MAAQEPSPQAVFDAMEQFNKQGNQIFVTLVKGREYPPATVDVRCRYVETVGDLRKKVAEKMGCPAEKQLLFYKQRELTPEMDGKTMLDLSLHTGFSVTGYDLVGGRRPPPSLLRPLAPGPPRRRRLTSLRAQREPPVYFPPVVPSPEGLKVACSMVFPDGVSAPASPPMNPRSQSIPPRPLSANRAARRRRSPTTSSARATWSAPPSPAPA